jgi:hypothetical protein
MRRFGQFLVVQTERLNPAGASATFDAAELLRPAPLDLSDTNLPRDVRESTVLLRHVGGLDPYVSLPS